MNEPAAPMAKPETSSDPPHKTTIILVSSTFLMLIWKYFASTEFLLPRMPNGVFGLRPETAAALSHFVAAFVLLGVVPAGIVKFVLRERLRDYGLQLGNWRTIRSLVLLAPWFALGGWLSSGATSLRDFYPIDPHAGESWLTFARHTAGYFLFYAGWEFHFRGYLLFGLRRQYGDTHAMLLQTALSCLLHIGKPASETFSSFGGGLLWGLVAFRSNSIVSGLLQHFLLGLMLDAGIVH